MTEYSLNQNYFPDVTKYSERLFACVEQSQLIEGQEPIKGYHCGNLLGRRNSHPMAQNWSAEEHKIKRGVICEARGALYPKHFWRPVAAVMAKFMMVATIFINCIGESGHDSKGPVGISNTVTPP